MGLKYKISSCGDTMLNRMILIGLITVLLPQCSLFFRTSVPIRTIYHQTTKTVGADTLVIFLPGRHSKAEDFATEGFVRLLQSSAQPIDSVAVDAHLGYYINRNLIERLAQDVVQPARNNGYKKIWIVGISIGGIGALLYNEKYHTTIDGVMVLAPFLGDKEVVNEIASSGPPSRG